MLDILINGFQIVFQPQLLVLITIGVIAGTIFGALPGVNAPMGVALMVPFTYSMGGVEGIAFLVAVYCAAITGGGITAILFRIPGTPSNAPTTFDGYPMAQNGKAAEALGVSLISSALGGTFAAICMMLLSKELSDVALRFGPAELFGVAMLGLSVLTSLDTKHPMKTFISGILGLFLATIGLDPVNGYKRFTFGSTYLIGGIQMIPLMIGVFAVTEVLLRSASLQIGKEKLSDAPQPGKTKTKLMSFSDMWRIKWTILRSSIIGTLVGILPGAGATIASFLGYATEVKVSKHPEKFGTGIIEGVAAAETSNNAATGGAMVPLLALGIPGGAAAAVMATALMSKGVSLGPLLLQTQPEYLSGTFASMIFTNIVMVVVAIWIARIFSQIMKLPYSTLGSIILVLAMMGSYALQNNIQNVFVMAISGIVGIIFVKQNYSPAALVLGLVLGDICENNLRRAVVLANYSFAGVISRPMTAVLLLTCIVLTIYPVIKTVQKKSKEKKAIQQ